MSRLAYSSRILFFLFAVFLMSCRPANGTGSLPDFTDLVRENADAVVNISTVQEAGEGARQRIPEFFRHFFEEFEGFEGGPGHEMENQGTGFIISEDGYVITNYHLVRNAEEIIVRLQDRRELKAEVVGTDEGSDMALIKVEASDLPVVRKGSSADLEVGEWVLAIGAPFGFEHTVTAGIVSAKERSLPNESYVPFIQTDVAINPGNSGGPLFNMDGEVVGINSQIVSRSGGFMGLSFAIPIDVAMNVVDQLREKGRVSRGWLGVLIQDVDRDLAESFGLDKPSGALIAEVMEDSPAKKAGFQAGDVVVEFNGEEIPVSSRLPHLVGILPPGTEAEAVVVRDGERMTLTVEIEELPEDMAGRERATPGPEPETEKGRLGIAVTELSGAERDRVDGEGVRVAEVESGSPARRAGVRPGDIIKRLGQHSIASPEEFSEAEKALGEGARVALLIERDGQSRFISVQLD